MLQCHYEYFLEIYWPSVDASGWPSVRFSTLSQLDTAYQYIIIDDVVGTGASLCEILYSLYTYNKKVNFFFIPVKDVKR